MKPKKPKYVIEIEKDPEPDGEWQWFFGLDKKFGNHSGLHGPARNVADIKRAFERVRKKWFRPRDMILGKDLEESEFPNRNNILFTSEHPEITLEMFFGERTLMEWAQT